MEQSYKRPKLERSKEMRTRSLLKLIFTLVILLAIPLVFLNFWRYESNLQFFGIVDSGSENVGPVEASRIVQIMVEPGQEVKAGDILVRFDSAQRLLDESMNDIKIRELEQRLVNRRDDLIEIERRCRDIVRKTEIDLEETLLQQGRDAADLEGLESELKLLDPLIEKKLVSETDVMKIRPDVIALRAIVKRYNPYIETLKGALASAQDDLKEASERRAQGEAEVDKALEAIYAAYERADSIRKANPTVLRALSDGRVTKIYRRPGDIVVDGEPVIRLNTGDGTTYVTGSLPAGLQDSVNIGDTLYITRLTLKTEKSVQSIKAQVVSMDEEVLDLFDTSGKDSSVTVRGRKVRIKILGDASDFIPGESVRITDKPLDALSSFLSPESHSAGSMTPSKK